MDPSTVDAIYAHLDCLRDSAERSGLIIMEMKMQVAMDQAQSAMDRALMLAGAITFVGLLVVKALSSSRLDRRARIAGAAATMVLVGVLSVKVPDWPSTSMRHDLAERASAARAQLAEQLADTRCPEAPPDEER